MKTLTMTLLVALALAGGATAAVFVGSPGASSHHFNAAVTQYGCPPGTGGSTCTTTVTSSTTTIATTTVATTTVATTTVGSTSTVAGTTSTIQTTSTQPGPSTTTRPGGTVLGTTTTIPRSTTTAPTATVHSEPVTVRVQGSLPFTGEDLIKTVLIGLILTGVGLALARRVRAR